jgi:cytochrome P450
MQHSRPGQDLAAILEEPGFYAGDPFPHYARLRREAPLAWNAQLGYWAVAKHADVVSISRDPEAFCSGKGILTFEIGVEYPSPPTMMHTDPPEHTRYRKLVQPGFAPTRMRALATRVRARADELVARVTPGTEFDAVEVLAVPFPLWIIAELIGIPESDWPRFYQWSEASIPGANDWPPEECQRLQAEMHEYLLETTRRRRTDPRDDIISVLAVAEVEGESLRDDELVMFLNQLLVAGNETTRHAISGGIAALAQRPDQWQRLVADRSLLDTATEEILRWTTPVISFMRTATRDTEIRGVKIASGDPLLLLYASANRDEDEFGANADEFDVGRDPNHEVALGFGPHFCLGAALARIEIKAMLEALLDRFTELEPAGDVDRTASFVIAGISRAPVVFR